MKKGTKNKRNKASARAARTETGVFRQIQAVEEVRLPYAKLLSAIVERTLDEWLPEPSDGVPAVVEVGAGIGQLRQFLTKSRTRGLHHTEPLTACITELRTRFPNATVSQASASALPLSEGSQAAVLGLAVFDVLDDLGAAVQEFRRVLAPGGRVIHFLDQNPYLKLLFERLRGIDMVPLPNVFSDPCAKDFPDDLFLIPRTDLEKVVGVLARRQHAYQTPLKRYLAVFSSSPLPTDRAIFEYETLAGASTHRDMLRTMLATALDLSTPEERAELSQFQGQTVSSAQHLAGRLAKAFAPEHGFELNFNEIVTAHSYTPNIKRDGPAYHSLCVGQHRALGGLPEQVLSETAFEDSPTLPNAQHLRELGMLVTVATKL